MIKVIKQSIQFTLVIALLSFTACNSSSQKEEAQEESTPDAQSTEKVETSNNESGETAELDNDQIQIVVDQYLIMKDALVKTDQEATAQAAATFIDEIASIESGALDQLKAELSSIKDSDDVEAQRANFNTISQVVYGMIKNQPLLSKTLYKQYCPMAFDNTGAFWISAEEEVLNPYFGDKMLHCGKVQETL